MVKKQTTSAMSSSSITCVKYFVTSLVVVFTAVCVGWIISPDTAATVWNISPISLCCIRDMVFRYLDPYVRGEQSQTAEGSTISSEESALKLFTLDELKQYDGTEGSKGLYLGFFGQVYDVEKGVEHYGPDGGYRFFTARDATRAFVTGDFTEDGLTDDVEGISPREMLEVKRWTEFYHTDYKPVGILVGRFYDANGKPTEAKLKADATIQEGLKEQNAEEEDKKKFPPCNSEWKESGSKVWCSNRSGGIARTWEGYPRKYYQQGASNWRCACVREEDLNRGMFREYDDCEPKSKTCKLDK